MREVLALSLVTAGLLAFGSVISRLENVPHQHKSSEASMMESVTAATSAMIAARIVSCDRGLSDRCKIGQ